MTSTQEIIKANKEVLYDYTLVNFVHKGPRRKVESIEIIPTNWLSVSNNKVFTSYMEGKIEGEDRVLVQDLIKTRADAPSDWPSYRVKIIGRAKDYEEAVAKSKTLEQEEESVLTCDSDEEIEDVQKKMMTSIKQRDFLKLQTDLFAKINPSVPVELENQMETSSHSEISFNETIDKVESTEFNNNNQAHNLNADESVPVILDAASSSTKENFGTHHPGSLNTFVDVNLPVWHTENLEHKIDFETSVLTELKKLNLNMSGLLKRQGSLEKFLLDKRIVNLSKGFVDLKDKYGIQIPFRSIDEFVEFDNNLKADKFLKQDVLTDLRSLLNPDGVITKCYVTMLKKYLTKDVGMKFTASRTSGIDNTKIVLKNTEFCRCMDSLIVNKRKSNQQAIEEKDLNSALSDVLSNVKKWKGLDTSKPVV